MNWSPGREHRTGTNGVKIGGTFLESPACTGACVSAPVRQRLWSHTFLESASSEKRRRKRTVAAVMMNPVSNNVSTG